MPEPQDPQDNLVADGGRSPAAKRAFLVALLCSGLFAVGYRLLLHKQLHQGLALFVGLPIMLGAVVTLATSPRSSLGISLKVTTLCLCVIAPLLGEGAVCVAMAAPLLLGVVALTVLIIRFLTSKEARGGGRVSCCVLLLGLSPLLWEPAEKQPGWQDHRTLDEVSTSIDLAASPAALWSALAESPADLSTQAVPSFLRLRLGKGPRLVTGHGMQVGATRQIHFDSDEYLGTVTRSEPQKRATFTITEPSPDQAGERVALWLRFVEVELQIEDLGSGHARLTQTTRYRRLLDPAVYFAPLIRWGVGAMHRYTLPLLTQPLRENPSLRAASSR